MVKVSFAFTYKITERIFDAILLSLAFSGLSNLDASINNVMITRISIPPIELSTTIWKV